MSSSPKLVPVTGVTGFLGSQVAVTLMNAGYAVRGTVRGSHIESLRKTLGTNYPLLELAQVDDIATGDFTEALKGVYAVIHVASPLADQGSPEDVLDGARNGALNVLRQVNAAGIKKVVLTCSWAATYGLKVTDITGMTSTEADCGEITKEEAIPLFANEPLKIYSASKVISESAAWDFAVITPDFDLATINPLWLFGPYVPHFPKPAYLGRNTWFYMPLQNKKPHTIPPQFVDIRDCARAHVAALGVPPLVTPEGGRNRRVLEQKRYLVCSGEITWKNVVQLLHEQRPELKERLLPLGTYDGVDVQAAMNITIDVTRAEKDLEIKEWTNWKTTLFDIVDSLLEIEKQTTIKPDDDVVGWSILRTIDVDV